MAKKLDKLAKKVAENISKGKKEVLKNKSNPLIQNIQVNKDLTDDIKGKSGF